jgi:uncharacterized membrane protein
MADQPIRCTCARCRLRGIMGPVLLITIGVLFLIAQVSHDYVNFARLSPILLIVIGVVKILRAVAPTDGHISAEPTAPVNPATPAAPGAAQTHGQ